MKTMDIDKNITANQDMTGTLDISRGKRPGQEQQRVNVDFPLWMLHSLDEEAKRLGVPRQAIIKFWIAERLKNGA